MNSIRFTEHGLNVQYFPKFIEKASADAYFTQLQTLPFYFPTLKIRGKNIKHNRLVLAYGDDSLSYTFSGTSIAAEPWTPLMLELRNQVEKFVGCTYNYALLNLYKDGTSSISQHKDDESSIDDTFPIAVLSFGAERTIEFKKSKTPSTAIKLQHGSLYTMFNPTNQLFSHAIAADPNVKDMRISLTFHHLITQPVMSPSLKKPRLVIVPIYDNVSSSDIPYVPEPQSVNFPCENATESYTKLCDSQNILNELLPNDWLTDLFQQEKKSDPILTEWDLSFNTFIDIIVDSNVRIHIRKFRELPNGLHLATKQGILLSTQTWAFFEDKLQSLQFDSGNDSCVVNNELLIALVNENTCLMQEMIPLTPFGYYLNPTVVKLSRIQIEKLSELFSEISDSLIKVILNVQLPKIILHQKCVSDYHSSLEEATFHFYNCLCLEIQFCAERLMVCPACNLIPSNHDLHECNKSLIEQFRFNRETIILCMNIHEIVKNLKKSCFCHYNMAFLKENSYEKLEQCLEMHMSIYF